MVKYNTKNRLAVILLVFVVSLVAIFALTGCGDLNQNDEQEEQATETADDTIYGDETLGIDPAVDEALRDYRSILLLGIDNGKRSDILIVATINKNTNEVKTVPVHRDTYMQIFDDEIFKIDGEEREFYKCNRAYQRRGMYGIMKELNRHMDLNIRECIGIDWQGTATLIDGLGGLTVNIDDKMLTGLKKLGLPEELGVSPSEYRVESVGEQTLSGWQAVQYLRVRKYKGGNAGVREERNQDVAKQLIAQAKDMSVEDLSKVYDDVVDNLDTNMSRNTLTDTIVELSTSQIENLQGWPYEYSKLWQDDHSYYYFVPDTLSTNVAELHKDLFGQEDYQVSDTVAQLNDRIQVLREEVLK